MAGRTKPRKPSAERYEWGIPPRRPVPKPRRGYYHKQHDPLDRNGEELAIHMAVVAVKALHAALSPDKVALEDMKRVGKYTEEIERLSKLRVPSDVREWIEKNFQGVGPVFLAVRSQVAIALQHAQAGSKDLPGARHQSAPGHLRPPPRKEKDISSTACCSPFCPPP